jgi:hypothetical protein
LEVTDLHSVAPPLYSTVNARTLNMSTLNYRSNEARGVAAVLLAVRGGNLVIDVRVDRAGHPYGGRRRRAHTLTMVNRRNLEMSKCKTRHYWRANTSLRAIRDMGYHSYKNSY